MDKQPKLEFRRISGSFAICRLPAAGPVPEWAQKGIFTSITRTADELSIVCAAENVPQEHKPDVPWICLKLQGPFALSEVGILKSFIAPLVGEAIPIFAIATFDTDYVLVQENFVDRALTVLKNAGHHLVTG